MKSDRLRQLFLNPWLRYFVGPGLMALGSFAPERIIAAGAVGSGWVLVAASGWAAALELRQQDAKNAISLLLDNATTCFEAASPSPADRTLRAGVFLVDEETEFLQLAYSTSGYTPNERNLQWARGQGCAGIAWERGTTVVAPEDFEFPIPAEAAEQTTRPWNMTVDQVRLAGQIASVIAVPLQAAEAPGNVVGVFVVDDTKPLDNSPLGQQDVQPAIEQLAYALRDLVLRAGRPPVS